jgi:hypothetical protein
VTDVSTDQKRLLASAAEVTGLLRRNLDVHRLYAAGHPSILGLDEGLHTRLLTHLKEFGPLELHISSLTLSVGDKVVLHAERREESISHALFLDGVRTVTFLPEVPLEEVSKLTEIWHATMHPAGDDGQTFATRLWEAGLLFVRSESVDALVDSTADAEALEQLLGEMKSGKAPFRAVPAGRLASQWNDRGSFEADLNARPTARANPQLFEEALTREETQSLVAELDRQRGEGTQRALTALVALAGTALPDQYSRIESAAGEIFLSLARASAFVELASVVQNIAQTIRNERRHPGAKSTPVLMAVLQQLDQAELIHAALAALSDPKTSAPASETLRFLPSKSVGHLLDELARQPDPALRRQLVELINGMLPSAEPIAERIVNAEPDVALQMLNVAQTMPAEDRLRILGLGLTHPAATVRLETLRRLKTVDVPAVSATLRKLAADPDVNVRRGSTDLLIRARDPEAAMLLSDRLEAPKLSPADRKSTYVALGTVGGEVAALTLRTEFRRQKDPDLRAACALALAQAGDEYSRPVLTATARKLLVPRVVKEACLEALRRLDARRSQRRAGEESP